MSEHDRLAALLERATQERRGGEGEREDAEPGAGGELDLPAIVGGEWLPQDPANGRHRAPREGPRVLTVPESLRSVNLSVRPIAVLAIVVVVLVSGVVFGLRWWSAEQAGRPVPMAPVASTQPAVDDAAVDDGAVATDPVIASGSTAAESPDAAGAHGPAAGDGVAEGATPSAAPSLVHVAGQVRHPGVVRLEAGARVQDAVDAAGGLTAQADTTRLNLARPVADGERLWVPRPGEEVPEVSDAVGGSPGAGGGAGGGASGGGGAGGAEADQINLNTADQAALEELPGVGPVTAGAIVAWRTDHGQFSTVEELLEVSGIGEATLEKLRPHVTL